MSKLATKSGGSASAAVKTGTKSAAVKPKAPIRQRGLGLYMRNVITRKIRLPFTSIGSNVKENLQTKLATDMEGKCVDEGYIRPDSVHIVSYSAGTILGKMVIFIVMLECLICRPVEGQRFRAVVKNVTKAGIRAETKELTSPVVVFIARDHHYKSKGFSALKEGDSINVRVIGVRYELNDSYISIIGELVEKKVRVRKIRKPKIVISGTEV